MSARSTRTPFAMLALTALMVSSNLRAGEPLTSEDAQLVLCEAVLPEVLSINEDNAHHSLGECISFQKAEVLSSKADPESGMVTILNVRTVIDAPEAFLIEAKAQLTRKFTVLQSGAISKRWVAGKIEIVRFEDRGSIEVLIDRLVSVANVHNGTSSSGKFDVAKLKLATEAARLEEYLPSSEDAESCQYATEKSAQAGWDLLAEQEQGTEAWDLLKQLEKRGEIAAILGRTWVEGGDSEYCSRYYFRIFLKSGYVIKLDYDLTT